MTVHLTEAQAKKLGIDVKGAGRPTKKRLRNTVAAADCAATRCVQCDARFERPVDEDRHFAANPSHRRYEMAFDG